jgi:ergothioneine biosynthesis protein EgtB
MATSLIERFIVTRAATERLAACLSEEDQLLQSMPYASPTKWHRAHTTWFFETFILQPQGIAPYDSRFGYLFNSYYDAVGDRIARPKRGLLSRPSAAEVGDYRRAVDGRMLALLERGAAPPDLTELGLNHEEQHQELILTDILHAFSENPTGPVYRAGVVPAPAQSVSALSWRGVEGGLVEVGAAAEGFAFDNERPRHRVYLRPYALASRPITVGEVKAFIAAGGYRAPSLWLSDGYALACAQGWRAPLYARPSATAYEAFSLRGWRVPLDDEPAAHLSFWEAEAIARFLGARLPTEAEWEHAATAAGPIVVGNFADGELIAQSAMAAGLGQLFGDVWEWTRSSHEPYPGYRAAPGALGEYNGKFMAQQMVLRGGSCLTPRGHVRSTYRNFWPPETRFQMAGARLARDL